MDVNKTIEFLLDTQARHDAQIAEIREIQKKNDEMLTRLSTETAEIRHVQKESGEMLSQIIKVVGDIVRVVDQHQLRLDGLK